ncbi:MAG: porin family protein [Bacteroidota bacterium]
MKFGFIVLIFFSLSFNAFSQDKNPFQLPVEADTLSVYDEKYREDQFYISITYNLLGNKPNNVTQSGFSTGYHIGFIRDMPINKRRNLALGLGFGLSSNSYNSTLLISESNSNYTYSVIDENQINFDKNKFTTYLIEFPLEFRWRTSTIADYNFWRIYTGFKVGYVVHNTSKFVSSSGDIRLSKIDDLNRFQYGLTFSAGYANISFHAYYGLNPIFNSDAIVEETGEAVDMNAIKIGLMFYIL